MSKVFYILASGLIGSTIAAGIAALTDNRFPMLISAWLDIWFLCLLSSALTILVMTTFVHIVT